MQPFLNDLMEKVQKTSSHTQDYLFRTFYYDCRPFGDTVTDPSGNKINYSQTAWKLDPIDSSKPPKPDFKQKSVDMKIGLDIAWMSNKGTVDKIVLVAGDSDFVAPMKFARKEGLLIYLYTMKQSRIKLELKEHCDLII